METRLNEVLWEDENVRWTGRPKAFDLMAPDSKTGILMTWIISAIVLVLTFVVVIPYLMKTGGSLSKSLVVTVVILFLPVILSFRPFLDKKCLEEDTFYAITNLRVIVISKNDPRFIPLDKELKVAVEHAENGHGNLCFGSVVGKPQKKSRALAVTGIQDDGRSVMQGLMFYHVEKPEQLLEYVA